MTSKARTIAVLLPDLSPGGAEWIRVRMSRQWMLRGHAVEFVLGNRRGALLEVLPEQVTVVGLGPAKRFRHLLMPLRRYLQVKQPDALLVAMWPLTAIAPLAARLAGFRGRVVVSEHAPLSIAYADRGPVHRALLRGSLRAGHETADARVAVSRGVARDLARLTGLHESHYQVIPNPAATGRACGPVPARPVELERLRGPMILAVGTLKQVKRFDLLIDAFARIARRCDATLCIVGEGTERERLEQQIATLRLSKRILLPGFAVDTAPWYAHADLFVLSSSHEGFGNVIVEAMEFGVPVVCTDCPWGPREILDDGRFGTLVAPGNAEALAAAMLAVLTAPVDRAALKERAAGFSVERAALAYEALMFPPAPAADKRR